MGCFSCLDSREDEEIHNHDFNLTDPSNISRLPFASGADKLQLLSNGVQTFTFRPKSLLGEGRFGWFYKGRLQTTSQVVAVKQLDINCLQGNQEFLGKVLMLSLLHHPNLENLIGYCVNEDQRLLVYEFMPRGSLEDHLHDLTRRMEQSIFYPFGVLL